MKFTILQNKLKQGLNCVEKIALRSPTLPILNNVLLSTEDNFLKLSTTNLEMGIHYWILAKIEKTGKIPVPASIFSNFVNFLSPSSLNLEVKEGSLLIEHKNIKSSIKGLNPDDFPIIPNVEKQEKAVLNNYSFCQSLSQIINITSFSSIRPEISGIYLCFKKNMLILAATDSFRLGEKKITFKKPLELEKEYHLILPQKAASFLVSVFEEKEQDIFIYFAQNLVMFESLMEEADHSQIQFVSKLIEGEYPKYEEIIPKAFKTEAILERKEFLNYVKGAGIFAGRINEIKLSFDQEKQKVYISCQNPELGQHSSNIQAEIKGKQALVSFNYKFLLDGLQSIKAEKILFGLSEERNNEEGPGILRPIGDDTYLYVVMPIQAS